MSLQKRPFLQNLVLLLVALILVIALTPSSHPAQAAPLYATALQEGRTYDQAHDTGFIDWSGTVNYENLYHRSLTIKSPDEGGEDCTNGCTEPITKISSGSSISGAFLRDVTYFEAMAAFEWTGTGVGTVTVEACTSSASQDLRKPNNNTAGFNSFALPVPAGCRNWTVRASGGHVKIRSVDAEYVNPTPTPTASLTPTGTLPPTSTPTSTATFTATATSTAEPTSTPTFTFTPSPTGTTEPTATFTPTATEISEPTQTPWVVTVPVVIVMQDQTVNSGGSGSGTLSTYAVTPTPPSFQNYAGGAGGMSCRYALRTFAYVDGNDDKLMSPNEGAENLEIVFMDTAYSRLGSRYTQAGQAVFCLNPAFFGQMLHVDIPYLHQSQTVNIPKSLDADVEVWFRLEQPTLPLYLP
jgi:hypothetical protein